MVDYPRIPADVNEALHEFPISCGSFSIIGGYMDESGQSNI